MNTLRKNHTWEWDSRRANKFIIHFLIFVLGVFTGYLWAAAAYGIF